MTPIEYALMFDWPMSSPKMTTMFGFFDCAETVPGPHSATAITATNVAPAANVFIEPSWVGRVRGAAQPGLIDIDEATRRRACPMGRQCFASDSHRRQAFRVQPVWIVRPP